jgi:hypothetical protein
MAEDTRELLPMACRMDAMTPVQRGRHEEVTARLRTETQEIRELPDGFAFRIPEEDWSLAAEFVSLERLCCPFLGFALEQEREAGPLWLRLTGREGVKEFLRAELSL